MVCEKINTMAAIETIAKGKPFKGLMFNAINTMRITQNKAKTIKMLLGNCIKMGAAIMANTHKDAY